MSEHDGAQTSRQRAHFVSFTTIRLGSYTRAISSDILRVSVLVSVLWNCTITVIHYFSITYFSIHHLPIPHFLFTFQPLHSPHRAHPPLSLLSPVSKPISFSALLTVFNECSQRVLMWSRPARIHIFFLYQPHPTTVS